MMYFQVKAVFEQEINGKIKKVKENYLVDAMTCTEAEARLSGHLIEQGERDFTIVSAVQTTIRDVIYVEDTKAGSGSI